MTESKFSKYSEMSEEKRAKLREIEVSMAMRLKLCFTGHLSLFHQPRFPLGIIPLYTMFSVPGNLHTTWLTVGLLVQASLLSCYPFFLHFSICLLLPIYFSCDFTCIVVCVYLILYSLLACLMSLSLTRLWFTWGERAVALVCSSS